MWPFGNSSAGFSARTIAPGFAVGGQISTSQLEAISAAGYKSIICARPDHEEPGQPTFAEIEKAATAAGIKSAHIPISGMVGEGAVIRMERALADLPGPIFAYCRSGARAGSLYAAAMRAKA